jgi:hypothetical protein
MSEVTRTAATALQAAFAILAANTSQCGVFTTNEPCVWIQASSRRTKAVSRVISAIGPAVGSLWNALVTHAKREPAWSVSFTVRGRASRSCRLRPPVAVTPVHFARLNVIG